MESSRYNIYIEDYPRNGYILIYNLYTRQIACVKERDPEKWSEVLFRKMKSKGFGGYCSKCVYANICRGGCTSLAYNTSGHINNNNYCMHIMEQRW